jgi:hypothetical protein
MGEKSSPIPSLEHLRALADAQGVQPEEEDLDSVLGFLTHVLPALHSIEERLPPETTV